MELINDKNNFTLKIIVLYPQYSLYVSLIRYIILVYNIIYLLQKYKPYYDEP